jgi:hypothetical protein
MGRQDRGVPPDPRPRPRRCPCHGRLRPLPPAVARQHAAVPGRQGAVLRRELLQRGAGVRPAPDDAGRRGEPVRAHPARRAGRRLRSCLQQRTADRPQHHLSDHHAAPAGGPADRAHLHEHLRAAVAAAAAVRPARPDDPAAGRVVAGGQAGGDHRHRTPVARTRRAAPVRCPRPRSRVRSQGRRVDRRWRHRGLPGRGDAGQPASARQRDPRVHGLPADDGRGRCGSQVDSLDLFHTMEAYFTWYPNGVPA